MAVPADPQPLPVQTVVPTRTTVCLEVLIVQVFAQHVAQGCLTHLSPPMFHELPTAPDSGPRLVVQPSPPS